MLPNAQQTVDTLKALQPYDVTRFIIGDDEVPRERLPFDVNQYFNVFTHLAMEPGYTLDYVYWRSANAGAPVTYARPLDAKPFSLYADYLAANGPGLDYMGRGDKMPMGSIRTDGTAEGYFEWVVLAIMGGQFYLYWGAILNDDATVICDSTTFERLADTISMTPDGEREARKIDFTPWVRFTQTEVTVRLVTFSDYNGRFVEETYTLSREPPISIIGARSLRVVQCIIRSTPPVP